MRKNGAALRQRRSLEPILLLVLLLQSIVSATAADSAKRSFNVPAGDAADTLKQFATQAKREIMFPAESVAGVRTNAIKGTFAPREALEKLVARSGLALVEDAKTGALMVYRTPPGGTSPASAGLPGQRTAAEAEKKRAPGTAPNPWLSADQRGREAHRTGEGDVVVLSPFEVDASSQRGYYGSNTLAGTRLNAKLEDLASSITVVTKEQMADFAMLDLNDIFLYEAGTEGSGTFTHDMIDRNGSAYDLTSQDPASANRIRGVGPASISMNNFETSGRVPVDPINIDAVEISRGPNSNLFGVGSAAGTVNLVGSSANMSRNRVQAGLRADSFGGHRSSLDVNRILLPNTLAVRGSAVFQHDGYVRKPSGTDTRRYNAMVRYQPFRSTTISGSFSSYRLHGNRANTALPVDGISNWRARGSPTFDPITAEVKINGVGVGTFPTAASLPQFGLGAGPRNNLNTQPSFFIGPESRLLMISRIGTGAAPNIAPTGNIRFMETVPVDRASQPLFARDPVVTDGSIYDWSSINTAAVNYVLDKTRFHTVALEQTCFHTLRQFLAIQVAWFRESSERFTHYPIGTGADGGAFGYLAVDVNERLLDGRPNPYFLRPFMATLDARDVDNPFRRESFRGQFAYRIDLTREKGALRWLGSHQLSGYNDYVTTKQRSVSYRTSMIDEHAWLVSGTTRGTSGGVKAPYYKYYLGDSSGQNIDHAPTPFEKGRAYPFQWFNGVTNQWVSEPVVLGLAGATDTSRGQSLNILKTLGGTLQSHLLNGRVVTTFGLRRDRIFDRRGGSASLLGDGQTFDFHAMDLPATFGPYITNQGRTRTAGVVVKVFRWLSLHVNESDNFRPAGARADLFQEIIPNPTGQGRDYGFTVNLWGGKLNVRAIQSRTTQLNAPGANNTAGFATRLSQVEFNIASDKRWALDFQSRLWMDEARAARGESPLTDQQFEIEFARLSGLPVGWREGWTRAGIAESDDMKAENRELEMNYNPSDTWTVKFNVTETKSFTTRVSDGADRWIARRLPIWTSIIDPRSGAAWYTSEAYGGGSAAQYVDEFVVTPLKLARGLVGKSNPQIRRYRANLSTNFRLSGITEHRIAKRFNVGGALRWEDKGAIGFAAVEKPPAVMRTLDPNAPIFDRAHVYVDLLIGYRTHLWSDRTGLTVQLNVRNLQERGRIQPIRVFPNGVPNTYRIVDPRQFILSAMFDL